jgi:uncharacterized coiled-coil DUF342 family protein
LGEVNEDIDVDISFLADPSNLRTLKEQLQEIEELTDNCEYVCRLIPEFLDEIKEYSNLFIPLKQQFTKINSEIGEMKTKEIYGQTKWYPALVEKLKNWH